MKILTIVGARPQFIKAAPVSRVIHSTPDLAEVMVHTGQHFDAEMSDVFFQELDIPAPAYHLGINGGGHGEMTGRMLAGLEPIMQSEQPDVVLVYGDTNSTLAGALAAAKLHFPVAHVEAGLRSFNRRMPEEINRVIADHLSTWLFCPTRAAIENLAKEGVSRSVYHVGDVMFDATLHIRDLARRRSRILDELQLKDGAYALATVHRAENTDEPARLREVVNWLQERANDRPVILPLHPRTRICAEANKIDFEGLLVCKPVGYLDMARLLYGAVAVYTDSGGVQKEAYFYRKPCVTLREETEWVETIACGWNRLWRHEEYEDRREIAEYGEGRAAQKIVDILLLG